MKRRYKTFAFFCCMVYFSSYVTRINFATIISEIVSAEGFLKSELSIIILINSLSYGVGQLITGKMGDKLNPVNVIFGGFILTVTCNLLIPLCSKVGLMSLVWMVNGFAQAMMWPPLVKIMSTYLNDDEYAKTIANVSISAYIGKVVVYLVAPVIISVFEWRAVFVFSSCVGILTALLWKICMPRLQKTMPCVKEKKAENVLQGQTSFKMLLLTCGLIFVCVAVALQGYIRDGIDTWLPSIISEVFKTPATSAILVSVILPIISSVSLKFFSYAQRKWISDELKFAKILFVISTVLTALWGIFYEKSMILAILFPGFISAAIHGINYMLTCITPRRFKSSGKISQIAGMMNFSTYIGSATAAYAMAKISETFGWTATFAVMVIICVLGFLCCTAARKKIANVEKI